MIVRTGDIWMAVTLDIIASMSFQKLPGAVKQSDIGVLVKSPVRASKQTSGIAADQFAFSDLSMLGVFDSNAWPISDEDF